MTSEVIPASHTVYVVIEQYPRREVATFLTLQEARVFVAACNWLALPIIVSRVV